MAVFKDGTAWRLLPGNDFVIYAVLLCSTLGPDTRKMCFRTKSGT